MSYRQRFSGDYRHIPPTAIHGIEVDHSTSPPRLIVSGGPSTSHGLGGEVHLTATLAELNAKVSDATLIDTGDSRLSNDRTPLVHGGDKHSEDYEPANTNIQSHISNTENPHEVTKVQVGLSNVDNTSDLSKPISTATQNALNLKVDDADLSVVGKSGSYNDLLNKPDLSALEEVLVYISEASFPAIGEAGKIYIAQDTASIHWWSGVEYIKLTNPTALWG